MTEAAKKAGQPCARCGMKNGAHDWRNRHPNACSEWVTRYELERDHEEAMGGWMFDPDMESRG